MVFPVKFGRLPHVVGISSSLKPNVDNEDKSLSRLGVREMLNACERAGATTDFIDLRTVQNDLPLCDGRDGSRTPYQNTALFNIENKIREADAVIIGTPNYKGGYTGFLKNLLDLLPQTLFLNKFVTFVISAGNPVKAMVPVAPLTSVVDEMQGLTLPKKVFLVEGKDPLSRQPLSAKDVVANNRRYIQKAASELVYYSRVNANARLTKPQSIHQSVKPTAIATYA